LLSCFTTKITKINGSMQSRYGATHLHIGNPGDVISLAFYAIDFAWKEIDPGLNLSSVYLEIVML